MGGKEECSPRQLDRDMFDYHRDVCGCDSMVYSSMLDISNVIWGNLT